MKICGQHMRNGLQIELRKTWYFLFLIVTLNQLNTIESPIQWQWVPYDSVLINVVEKSSWKKASTEEN